LKQFWEESKNDLSNFYDFIPIRIVTIIEVFIRELVRGIIDSGSPYIERAETLFKGIKLDFAFAISLHGRKVTIGDLIANSLSINNIDQITSIIETLIAKPFRKNVSEICDRWQVEIENKPKIPIIEDIEEIYKILAKLFYVRHILTHEIPRSKLYELDDIDAFFKASTEFLRATEELVLFELHGNVPLTQAGMNQHAFDTLTETMTELDSILEKVKSAADVNVFLLEEAQTAWETFAMKEANFHAGVVEGGSMQPMIFASTKEELTRRRINELAWWLNREEGEL
jgi:uncharacterized protein YecT (DUF1311 family)